MQEKEAPFFSVIVPVYNVERDLENCIDSILSQTFTDFELFLVDDGSTDKTPAICDRAAGRDSRIKVIHKKNEGVAAARNDGLWMATGKYVYYVDGDDRIAKTLLQEAYDILHTSQAPDIFVFGYSLRQKDGSAIAYVWPGEAGVYDKERLKKEVYPSMYHTGVTRRVGFVSTSLCDKIIKRDLLKEHYCRNTALFAHEDLVCAYECMYFAHKVYFSSSILYYYNPFSHSSMHRRYHTTLFENNHAVGEYLYTYLGGRGDIDIDKQINRIVFDGLAAVVYQEIEFGSSLWHSADILRKKWKKLTRFPICPVVGLTWSERCYVYLLSCRFLYISLMMAKILVRLVAIWKKWKYRRNFKYS